MRQPRAVISGRRLLLAVAVWLVLAGAGFAPAAVLLRLAGAGWGRAHRADVLAALLLEAYLALLAALLATFGGPSGLRRELGFHFTSPAHLALAFATWLTCLVAGTLLGAAFAPIVGRPPSNAAE